MANKAKWTPPATQFNLKRNLNIATDICTFPALTSRNILNLCLVNVVAV